MSSIEKYDMIDIKNSLFIYLFSLIEMTEIQNKDRDS